MARGFDRHQCGGAPNGNTRSQQRRSETAMYQKIFCPVDGSEPSSRGMREAILLARDQKAELLFLHVVDFSSLTLYGPMFGSDFDVFREAGQAIVAAALEEAAVHGVTAQTRLAETMTGGPGQTIVQEAEKFGADLIVMGTHGRRGLNRLLVGSDAATVLGQCRIPILLVK
jgi:nucleotide-binding universal stress UspA family protein